MILCEFTPEGYPMQRLSLRDKPLTYQWFGYIKSIASLKFQMSKKYGGYAKPTFSDISFIPTVFEDAWPPPKKADIILLQTDTDEFGGVLLFNGTAQRASYNRKEIKYNLRQPEFDVTVTTSTAYDDTLVDVATAISTSLGLSINTTLARVTSPDVLFTTTKDTQAIDLLDDMCSFFSHGFKIIEGTLYLMDMLGTETGTDLTEFDVLPCSYKDDKSISLVTSGEFSVAGSSPNGDEHNISTAYHTTQGNVETALTDIKTILERDLATVNAKISDTQPQILDRFTLFDESSINPLTTTARVTSIIYNYNSLNLQIEGHGAVV